MRASSIELIGDCALRVHSATLVGSMAPWLIALGHEFKVVSAIRAFDSVTVRLAPGEDLARCADIAQRMALALAAEVPAVRVVEIPLAATPGEDLEALAENARLSKDQFLSAFCDCTFEVAQIGFQPGFPYLRGLPLALAMPRRSAPRPRVAPGSVAIGGQQAGIYPNASPGGWQLLGHTPLKLFDPLSPTPCLLAPGDRVRFVRCQSAS